MGGGTSRQPVLRMSRKIRSALPNKASEGYGTTLFVDENGHANSPRTLRACIFIVENRLPIDIRKLPATGSLHFCRRKRRFWKLPGTGSRPPVPPNPQRGTGQQEPWANALTRKRAYREKPRFSQGANPPTKHYQNLFKSTPFFN